MNRSCYLAEALTELRHLTGRLRALSCGLGYAVPKEGSTMDLQPLYGRVLVTRVEADKTTKGGLIIPEKAKDKPQVAKVVALSECDADGDPHVVEVGQRVLVGRYSGDEIEVEGTMCLFIAAKDILSIVL